MASRDFYVYAPREQTQPGLSRRNRGLDPFLMKLNSSGLQNFHLYLYDTHRPAAVDDYAIDPNSLEPTASRRGYRQRATVSTAFVYIPLRVSLRRSSRHTVLFWLLISLYRTRWRSGFSVWLPREGVGKTSYRSQSSRQMFNPTNFLRVRDVQGRTH